MYCHWSNSFNKNFNTKNSMGFRGKFWYLEGDMGQTGMFHTQFLKIFVKEKVWVFYENIIKSMREQYGSNRIVPDRFFFDKVWTLKNIWPCKNMYKILKRTTWAKLHFPRNNYLINIRTPKNISVLGGTSYKIVERGILGKVQRPKFNFSEIFVTEKLSAFNERLIKSLREQYDWNCIVLIFSFFLIKFWILRTIWV